MKRQNRKFTKFISLLKFPGLQYRARWRTISAQCTATERDFCPALMIEYIEQCSFYVMILGCLIFLARVVVEKMQPNWFQVRASSHV